MMIVSHVYSYTDMQWLRKKKTTTKTANPNRFKVSSLIYFKLSFLLNCMQNFFFYLLHFKIGFTKGAERKRREKKRIIKLRLDVVRGMILAFSNKQRSNVHSSWNWLEVKLDRHQDQTGFGINWPLITIFVLLNLHFNQSINQSINHANWYDALLHLIFNKKRLGFALLFLVCKLSMQIAGCVLIFRRKKNLYSWSRVKCEYIYNDTINGIFYTPPRFYLGVLLLFKIGFIKQCKKMTMSINLVSEMCVYVK